MKDSVFTRFEIITMIDSKPSKHSVGQINPWPWLPRSNDSVSMFFGLAELNYIKQWFSMNTLLWYQNNKGGNGVYCNYHTNIDFCLRTKLLVKNIRQKKINFFNNIPLF